MEKYYLVSVILDFVAVANLKFPVVKSLELEEHCFFPTVAIWPAFAAHDSNFSSSCSRKRRAEESHVFKKEDVIVLSIVAASDNTANPETKIALFVLDPSSSSPLPDSAFSTEDLKAYIKQLSLPGLTNVESGEDSPNTGASSGDKSTSKAPVIAGVIIAILVVAFIVLGAWFYNRRRKNKK